MLVQPCFILKGKALTIINISLCFLADILLAKISVGRCNRAKIFDFRQKKTRSLVPVANSVIFDPTPMCISRSNVSAIVDNSREIENADVPVTPDLRPDPLDDDLQLLPHQRTKRDNDAP